MTIFDTDTFTYFAQGNANIRARLARLDAAEELAVTIITRVEVLRGRFDSLLKAADEDELRVAVNRFEASRELLDDFLELPLDETALGHFARLRKDKKVKKMGRADMLIASIALAHDALLVTRNTKDYKAVPGLRLENWTD